MFEVFQASSGDTNGRKLGVQVLDDGLVVDLTNVQLYLAWEARNKKESSLDRFKVIDGSKGLFEIFYTTEMLSNKGNVTASLVLVDSVGRIESDAFNIMIKRSLVDDESIESENSFTALTEALIQINKYQSDIDGIKQDLVDESNQLITTEKAQLDALQLDYADRAETLEETYAPKLTEVTAQLVQTNNLKADKNTVWSMAHMGQDIKTAMTGGSVAVVGENAVLEDNIVDGQVTPEKLAYIQRGKNKFNGNYVKGIRLGGSITDGSFITLNTENAISVVFEGETGLTYTITRSLGSDYWGVGTFDHYPEAGEKPLRGLNENGAPWTSKTVSLQDGEKYIMISISSTGIIPKEFQIEEGTVATDYSEPNKVIVPIENGSLTFDSLDKKTVSVTPDMTSFAKKGKNLFDGNFNNGLRFGGALPNLAVSADATAKSVVFKGEKGKTYTLSRSTENDRYGVAVFTRQPAVGVTPTRSLAGNTLPIWSEKTITLTGDEEYIMAFVSTTTPPELFQIEEGSIATSYSPVGAVKILLEDDSKNKDASTPKIHVIKSGNVINIYTPSKNDSSRYLCFTYERVTNATINTDSWLQTKSGVYRKTGDSYSLEFMLSTAGDQEGVLRVRGEADFIGGGVHGHEQVQVLSLLIDGKEYDVSGNINTECSFVKIVQASTVYHNGTSVKAFQKYKASTWDLDKYTIDSKWIAEDETNIEVSKVGIFSVLKTDNGRTPIKWGRDDANFEKTDVSVDFKSSKLMTEKRADITWQELWGETENFYVNLKCEYDRNKYSGKHYIEDFGNRAKLYFDLGEFIMNTGDSVRYKNVLDFRF